MILRHQFEFLSAIYWINRNATTSSFKLVSFENCMAPKCCQFRLNSCNFFSLRGSALHLDLYLMSSQSSLRIEQFAFVIPDLTRMMSWEFLKAHGYLCIIMRSINSVLTKLNAWMDTSGSRFVISWVINSNSFSFFNWEFTPEIFHHLDFSRISWNSSCSDAIFSKSERKSSRVGKE